jgi:phage tail-like protein
MRGLVDGLASPHPMAVGLPSIFQEEDPFTVRFTEAFDDSLAPIFATLDNLAAYFNPRYAPEDFLGWLAGWVAIELDETWDIGRRRAAVLGGADLLRRRGTAIGLATELELATGGQVEVSESGGSAWSLDAGSPMVGSARPALLVRIRVDDPKAVDAERVAAIVDAAKPAHVPHRIEIVGSGPAAARRPKKATADTAPDDGSDGDGGAGAAEREPTPPPDAESEAAGEGG